MNYRYTQKQDGSGMGRGQPGGGRRNRNIEPCPQDGPGYGEGGGRGKGKHRPEIQESCKTSEYEDEYSVPMYAIQNNSGQWWTGSGWGVKEVREEYRSLDDLPDQIDGLDLEIFATPDQGGFLDARYYFDEEQDAEAGVKEVSASSRKAFLMPTQQIKTLMAVESRLGSTTNSLNSAIESLSDELQGGIEEGNKNRILRLVKRVEDGMTAMDDLMDAINEVTQDLRSR